MKGKDGTSEGKGSKGNQDRIAGSTLAVSEDVTVSLIKNGDHRLSEPDDITRLILATERIGNML